MDAEIVGQDGNEGAEPDKPAGGGKKAKDDTGDRLKSLEDELKALRNENRALSESERYWADRAKSGSKDDPEPEPEEDDIASLLGEMPGDDDDVDSLIDELTSGGTKALTKRGLIHKKDLAGILKGLEARFLERAEKIADSRVGNAKKGLEQDAELLREYPELANIEKDPENPFVKATSKHYSRILKRSPERAKDPSALFDAAEMARLEVGNTMSDRQRRINAQADGGRGGPDGEDTGLTERQRKIIADFGITEEAYKKRASEGIQLKGMPMHGAMQQ